MTVVPSATLGNNFSNQQLSFNQFPPTISYFEVSMFPGYLNVVKIADLIKKAAFASGNTKIQAGINAAIWLGLVAYTGGIAGAKSDKKLNNGLGASVGFGLNPLDFRFNTVSGLELKIETQEVRCGGLNTEQIQLPTRVTHGNLILKRGIYVGSPLSVEFSIAMALFTFIPGEILVTLQNSAKEPQAAWLFRNAYPVSWSNSDLNADNSNVVIETMEFTYTHMYPIRF